ncbi:hypothetical protein TraAM80_01156 [Trypanosoma rangeli]|uniref:Transmembrane protein n=1 Tax=Trypanosoma rangeli TaxID=5698 RepID=A0A422P016_TRYRA|nr:uncharacterized protein TraAM80_01156 [Trypanosoma rangeli]RNF11029.1 hypothetical protein TraAM80_01156 [Trypanosoma rangeli]|eukprot:RNF11029.1 hypothetical protein TraAM80_01156 [Trypanosoma rangeli]
MVKDYGNSREAFGGGTHSSARTVGCGVGCFIGFHWKYWGKRSLFFLGGGGACPTGTAVYCGAFFKAFSWFLLYAAHTFVGCDKKTFITSSVAECQFPWRAGIAVYVSVQLCGPGDMSGAILREKIRTSKCLISLNRCFVSSYAPMLRVLFQRKPRVCLCVDVAWKRCSMNVSSFWLSLEWCKVVAMLPSLQRRRCCLSWGSADVLSRVSAFFFSLSFCAFFFLCGRP